GPFPRGGLARGISDGRALLKDPAVRRLTVERARAAGASVIRIPVNWSSRVLADPPAGFDPTDPASPAYDFGPVDGAVRDTVSAGLRPLLVVSHAPPFAEAPRRWRYAYPGSWAPSPQQLQSFAVALARRYGGSFPDPARPSATLPRVTLFQAWNEPNLPRYLEPQWIAAHGRWEAFSPRLYRQLLNAFSDGVKSVDPGAVVVAAGVAPSGDPAGVGRMSATRFLAALLCRGCPDAPRFDVMAFHPLSVGNPDLPNPSATGVSVADAVKVTRLVHKPVWVTELNWQSSPPARIGVPPRLQAHYVSRALHRLWVAGIGLVDWQFMVDPFPALTVRQPDGSVDTLSRPAGLYSAGTDGAANARPKPFLRGFTMPFDPMRIDPRRVRMWALLMSRGERAILQRRDRRGWRTIASVRASAGNVVNAVLPLRGSARLRIAAGTLRSAVAAVGR
ncbi:MAG: hypothetical protein JWN32_3027, partial [Solirubrobacterales bacterium]|nr:hypothetical protein [Solirubrobacterales bacterium]